MKKKNGFTVVELLFVILIIGIITGVAIPIFRKQIVKARIATDKANVRTAVSLIEANIMIGIAEYDTVYYFDAANGVLLPSPEDIEGYGQYGSNDKAAEIGAPGYPKFNEIPNYISISMSHEHEISVHWGKEVFFITSRQAWWSSSYEERLKNDIELVDSLQNKIRSMTYRELIAMFGTKDSPTNQTLKVEKWTGTCYTLAASYFDSDGLIDTNVNHIWATKLFDDIGYDRTVGAQNQYLITSWEKNSKTDPIYIKVDIKKDLSKIKEEDLDKVASDALVYINGGGYNTRGSGYFGRGRYD